MCGTLSKNNLSEIPLPNLFVVSDADLGRPGINSSVTCLQSWATDHYFTIYVREAELMFGFWKPDRRLRL